VVKSVLADHHLPVTGLAAVDGSGLDRSDRATCDLLLAALRTGASGPLAAGLAVADQTGTLEKRFTGSPVAGHIRAKTGSLDGVSALSGFAQARTTTLAFSLVLNDLPRDALGPGVWEAVGRALVAYPNAPDPKDLGPA
jgi:D-alanyl-D-alanine carboxypeptidase/D-alanyl-D-alanine-endopeptidase (penicillin-binding protein 4)